ncbi:hypothetical protein [Sinorhizobium alkalisoli]|uniref:hypothetical protein n=1 Tax=Sinorhizobium alkalisoli TaxID=1752398 RepID=UPI00124D4410|nr:hypothetical protein [Sinorhizobium alkalisoli]
MAEIVGWSTWQRRIELLRAELAGNPLWEQFLRERHGLELAFGDVRQHLRATGRYRWPPKTAEEYRLYSFLAGAVGIYAYLSAHAQRRFAGALRTALDKEFGLGPLAFEVKVAVHLVSRGFDVEFHDLESGGGFDFLAASGTTRIEVECKHLSADVGRQIHRRKLYALSGVLQAPMERALREVSQGQLVRVTLPGRLSGNKDEQQALADRIGAIVRGKADIIDDQVCIATVQPFALETSPFTLKRGHSLVMEDVQHYLREAFGIDGANVVSHWHPGRAAIIVSIESRERDRVLHQIFRHLKADAKKQFSGELPAFLCVHLADVTEAQLLELADAERTGTVTGLQRVVSALLQRRPHLYGVAIMTDGHVRQSRQRGRGGVTTSVREVGPSYVFHNPNHALASDQVLGQVFL